MNILQLLPKMRTSVNLLYLSDNGPFFYNFTDGSHDVLAAVASHVAVVTTGSLPILQQLLRRHLEGSSQLLYSPGFVTVVVQMSGHGAVFNLCLNIVLLSRHGAAHDYSTVAWS
jgi:hypothetical protein